MLAQDDAEMAALLDTWPTLTKKQRRQLLALARSMAE